MCNLINTHTHDTHTTQTTHVELFVQYQEKRYTQHTQYTYTKHAQHNIHNTVTTQAQHTHNTHNTHTTHTQHTYNTHTTHIHTSLIPPREDQCEWHRMTRMTGPDCVVMCNLINTHTHTQQTHNAYTTHTQHNTVDAAAVYHALHSLPHIRRRRRAARSLTSQGMAEPLCARIESANREVSEGKADL